MITFSSNNCSSNTKRKSNSYVSKNTLEKGEIQNIQTAKEVLVRLTGEHPGMQDDTEVVPGQLVTQDDRGDWNREDMKEARVALPILAAGDQGTGRKWHAPGGLNPIFQRFTTMLAQRQDLPVKFCG